METLSLFAEDSDSSLRDRIVAAARAEGTQYPDHTREQSWASALRRAADEIVPRKQRWPDDVVALVEDAEAGGELAHERLTALCATDEELAKEHASWQGMGSDDAFDDDDDEEAEANEYNEEPEEEEEAQRGTGADDAEREAHFEQRWEQRRDRTLAIYATEIARRAQPGFDRIATLERAFVERYGAATEALRDVLVSFEMADADAGALVLVNGAPLDRTVRDEHILPGDDEAMGDLLGAIARVREAAGAGLPAGYSVEIVPRTYEHAPRLADGVRRRYHRCPCCGGLFDEEGDHECELYGAHDHLYERQVVSARGEMPVTTRCALEPRKGYPFGASVIARTSRGVLFISPEFGYRRLASRVRRRLQTEGAQLSVRVDDSGIHLTEQLPPLPETGTVVNERLTIHGSRRVTTDTTLALDAWWAQGFRRDVKADVHERVIRRGTAIDVIAYRSTPRTTPMVISREAMFDARIDELIGAIVGDRIDSPFGPRVSEIIEHPQKPKAQRERASEERDHLRRLIRDGDRWRTVVLTVDPIESFDKIALTKAVLADLQDCDRPHYRVPMLAVNLVRQHGAIKAFEIARIADDEERDYTFELEQYERGYTDAASAVTDVVRHYARCPDCGVYEDCHGPEQPFPCGEPNRIHGECVDRTTGRFVKEQQLGLLA